VLDRSRHREGTRLYSFKKNIMEILNLSKTSGYPHQLINDIKNNVIQFTHNDTVNNGDKIKVIIGSTWRYFEIIDIIESRKPKGSHKDENAMWFNTSVIEIESFE
jgi:hypothetical protein